jgi:hypothetical protein
MLTQAERGRALLRMREIVLRYDAERIVEAYG